MKKVILGIFVLGLVVSATTIVAVTIPSKVEVSPCVTDAVSKREAATLVAWNVFNDKMSVILEERKKDLEEAWAATDTSNKTLDKSLVNAVMKESNAAKKAVVTEYRTAKKAAWDTFRVDAKACGGKIGPQISKEKEVTEKLDF
jgi:hypothetical protein